MLPSPLPGKVIRKPLKQISVKWLMHMLNWKGLVIGSSRKSSHPLSNAIHLQIWFSATFWACSAFSPSHQFC
ncbi:hypothetical protein CVT26_004572 [Gymnopilus dilepis]|uniref:Uncharacterized protein n=1 Tax=Gymnopilus dilepis TaxID=231916 RepID=A0A409YU57_9AGAR|nr:hypothetical protein CVT26_004572 [Gymnopilus dilepis]